MKATSPVVDRSFEGDWDDAEIAVTLPCGFKVRFWLMGLSDQEYIRRAQQIKASERDSK